MIEPHMSEGGLTASPRPGTRTGLLDPPPPPPNNTSPPPQVDSGPEVPAWSAAGSHHLPWGEQLAEVNKELWLILSMLVIVFLLNFLVTAHYVVLGFYTLPTLFSAYYFGRRHATLTALASILTVVLLTHLNPNLFREATGNPELPSRYYDLVAWGGILVLTAFTMGTLHQRHAARVQELKRTYQGLLMILRHFISRDQYTENHSYRVSLYAATIAGYLHFPPEAIEEVRAAALLHDIGKLEISRQLLHKAAKLTEAECRQMKSHVAKGAEILAPVAVSPRKIIPIILAHHDHFEHHSTGSEGDQPRPAPRPLPLAARIIAVADVFDALTSDRPYRKAMSPFAAKEIIKKGAGKDFDPRVVGAFQHAFQKGELEIPEICL